MAKRKSISKKKSRSMFKKTQSVDRINIAPRPQRGGYRI